MKLILILLISITISVFSVNIALSERCDNDITRIFSTSKWNATKDAPLLKAYVNRMYGGNVKKTERLLQTINQFDLMEPRTLGYRFLFDEIEASWDRNSTEMMALVFNVQMNMMNNTKDENLDYIMQRLPDYIRSFPFMSERVRIKNIRFPLYLFADDDNNANYIIDKERRMATVGKDGNTMKSEWELHPNRIGSRFKIFNRFLKKYLYADVQKADPARRYGLIWRSDEEIDWPGSDEWLIEPFMDDMGFRIKNVYWDEYLYTFDSGRPVINDIREVFLWRNYGCEGNRQCLWMFENISSGQMNYDNDKSY